jgi:Zn-dependent peptidase ImmA (M78 family)/DNA-binding XRE family transcriptional regulator
MSGIGERLKLARRMARMSQQELADQSDVSKMAISKYENNQMMPGSEVLVRMAEALNIRIEFLLRQPADLSIQPTYRKHEAMSAKSEEAVVAEIQEWLERYQTIESFFPEAERDVFAFPDKFPYPVNNLEDIEAAAEALRRAWQLGTDATQNLTEMLESHGIKVGLVRGDEHFDACTFWVNETLPVIAAKPSAPGDRQRFSLAHELGHLMLEVGPDVDEEQAANRFAGAFLVPAGIARRELGHSRHSLDAVELLMLKQKYGLSMNAWIIRARDLGILSTQDADVIRQEFRQRGWRNEEPGLPLATEQPGRMIRLVRRLVAEDVISRARAADLLGERLMLSVKEQQDALALHR